MLMPEARVLQEEETVGAEVLRGSARGMRVGVSM